MFRFTWNWHNERKELAKGVSKFRASWVYSDGFQSDALEFSKYPLSNEWTNMQKQMTEEKAATRIPRKGLKIMCMPSESRWRKFYVFKFFCPSCFKGPLGPSPPVIGGGGTELRLIQHWKTEWQTRCWGSQASAVAWVQSSKCLMPLMIDAQQAVHFWI